MPSTSFLDILSDPLSGIARSLINTRTNRPLASVVEIAATRATRRRGLLGRDGLARTTALVIVPCSSVHTFFMRFTIDVAFVDRRGSVLKIVRDLQPWRIAGSRHAQAVIEMSAGGLPSHAIAVGDVVTLGSPNRAEATD